LNGWTGSTCEIQVFPISLSQPSNVSAPELTPLLIPGPTVSIGNLITWTLMTTLPLGAVFNTTNGNEKLIEEIKKEIKK